MSKEYIPSTVFKTYINLFSKLMDLPQTAMLNDTGVTKEYTLFHRLELVNYNSKDASVQPTLNIKSYAIQSVTGHASKEFEVEINPEYEFTKDSIFWAGAPTKVFKDYMALNDKKYGSLSWCSSYERELYYPAFIVDQSRPIFEMQITLSTLELLEVHEEKRVKVGMVDESGNFTPAKQIAAEVPAQKREVIDFNPVQTSIAPAQTPKVFTYPRGKDALVHKVGNALNKFITEQTPTFG